MDGRAANCPQCDVPLLSGQLRIRGTIPGFLVIGLSYQHLWWTDPEGSRASREVVLDSGDEISAGRCPECGLVAFVPRPS